jgi:nucleoside-diphosphate-sugar epimerase
MKLQNKKAVITGASFIGSHLIKKLIDKKVGSIKVVNLSKNHFDILKAYIHDIELISADLRNLETAQKYIQKMDIVFHLAADHGGRGYVNKYQADTASNLLLDGSVFFAALKEGVQKIFFSSSGCVYPNYLQIDSNKKIYLKETDVRTPYDADNMYGWAKLMGELTLKNYYQEYGLRSVIGRFFTVYGENADESHAVIGSIAKTFIRQDPYKVWGDGKQIRNWTYVEDIVDGIILAMEKIDDATSINLGTQERITVNKMISLVFKHTGFKPKTIHYLQNMPSGPVNRVANISLAKQLLGWRPKYNFNIGLQKTVCWYLKTKSKQKVKKHLETLLLGK